MCTSVLYLLFSFFLYCNALHIPSDFTTQKKLHIDIYYESLCPDCKEFLTEQLPPAYVTFKNYIDLVYIPFGHSKSIKNGTATVFECQHGPEECFGNMLQSCVLDVLGDDRDRKAHFVSCQMHDDADPSGKNCTMASNIPYKKVMECVNGTRGTELQLEAEKVTNIIAQEIISKTGRFGVAAIVFDKVYNESDDNAAQTDFSKIICQKLRESTLRWSKDLVKTCASPQLMYNTID